MEKVALILITAVVAYIIQNCNNEFLSAFFYIFTTGVLMHYMYALFIYILPSLEKGFNKINGVLL